MVINLFGFEIKRKDKLEKAKSIVPPAADGSTVIETNDGFGGGLLAQAISVGADAKDEFELIKRYRALSMLPEVETAVDDILNEAVVTDENSDPVSLNLDEVDNISAGIKKQVIEEFSTILKLMNFNNSGYDIFKRFYVDGRLYYDKVVDEEKPKNGILELRQIDALSIKKIKEVVKEKDQNGVDVEKEVKEFFIYTPRPKQLRTGVNTSRLIPQQQLKISSDRIAFIHSGLIDPDKEIILSYLHKAIKPSNQLQLIEDSTVIYRLSRAPERRVFYIDVGNMPKTKAEQYVKQIMNQYKNKTVYDSASGEVVNQRNHLSMLEDFFLPRREGGKGTEIATTGGGGSLGDNEETDYFKKRLYRALNVPFSRVESDSAFNLGRSAEITRDEIKFGKFVSRLRNRFTMLFDDILGTQLILKGIMKPAEWDEVKHDVQYDFLRDSHFVELKEAEILSNRLEVLGAANEFIGSFFSKAWVKKNILKFTEEEIAQLEKEIKKEEAAGEFDDLPDGDSSAGGNNRDSGDEEEPEEEPPEEEPEDDEEDDNTDDKKEK